MCEELDIPETFLFSSDAPHDSNAHTMSVFLEEFLPDEWYVSYVDGTYAEIQSKLSFKSFEVHASGNGDFFNHKIEFVPIG
ncbi:MAG: hypothetical protein ACRCXB_08815 [Aeromonadaceae bacterium]